ncbi:restriction endonuclease subunit M/S [Streptomyces sp. WAC05374]|nr:restriction endonuclease subunit M/S [Streptomyces sp. WAC05374]TDF43339.1 restriction endonuclease subunit M/S [Streptomyces sp. WAC05374]TDF51125.1 restriction endonuclease subunit M/S [Streptomyces sp. WAC05374]TDF52339.1 restriction endonuclease subunit M/S [Streptomyces sp. WAC05374]
MLTVLMLARFLDSADDPGQELVKRWSRAVAEAQTGYPPLRDLNDALFLASRHDRFPVLGPWNPESVFAHKGEAEDLPWVAAFLAALHQPPTAAEAGLEEVADLLLERYVAESAAPSGEYHTPRTLTRLLAESLSPQPGDRVLDPACGTGGFLAAAARHIAQQGHVDGASFEGYAMDHRNPHVAMLNLALHGIDRPLVRASDPGSLFRSPGNGMAEFVLCNPPFNQRVQGVEHLDWPFGPPPESNANFAWIQLAWTRLSEKGKAAVIMPSGAASARGRSAEIRKALLAEGALLAVVALPADLFSHTTVPVHLWLLARDKSRHVPVDETQSVLFIDASRLGTQAPRRACELGPADRDRISGRFHAWLRSPRATPDEPGFSCSVSHDEILENDGCLLDPRLYVAPAQEQPAAALDTRRLLDGLAELAASTAGATARLSKSFDRSERVARGEREAPRVPLRRLVEGTAEGLREARGLLLAGPSGSLIRADHYVDAGGVPVVMPKDLTGSGFSTSSIRCISERQALGLERFHLRPGDVVLARRGELGRAAVVREEQHGWVCGTGCFLLRPPAELDADYFAAYLRGSEARTWLEAHSTGSMKMKTISLDVLGDLPVVLPDLATQQVIADTMKRLDENERLLREQLALTQRIRHDALDGGIIPAP